MNKKIFFLSSLVLFFTSLLDTSCKPRDESSELKVIGKESSHKMAVAITKSQSDICSATVVGANAILTAAHCLKNDIDGGITLLEDENNKSIKVYHSKSLNLKNYLSSKQITLDDGDVIGGDIAIVAMSKGFHQNEIATIQSNFTSHKAIEEIDFFVAGYGLNYIRVNAAAKKHDTSGAGTQRSADIKLTFDSYFFRDKKQVNSREVFLKQKLLHAFSNEPNNIALYGDSGAGAYSDNQFNKYKNVHGVLSSISLKFNKDEGGTLEKGSNIFISTYGQAFQDILSQTNPDSGELCKRGICVLLENPELALQLYFKNRQINAITYPEEWNKSEDEQQSYIDSQKLIARIKHYLVYKNFTKVNANRLRIVNISSENNQIKITWTEDFSEDDFQRKVTVSKMNRSDQPANFASGQLIVSNAGTDKVSFDVKVN